ncbi:MAG: nitroreductase family protein [Acholeplasmataceae bacterium]|nr:nitroreductase family protein [Acholeplasmataceae bacterium]
MIEAIKLRKSVRTYLKKPLTKKEEEIVKNLLSETEKRKGPFGNRARFFYYSTDKKFDDEAKRIGTYGFVKNAPSFFGGVIHNSFEGIIDFGYLFEHLIIELTKHDFGTVWLGGTFSRSAFESKVNEHEVIPAISPVGYPIEKISLMEKAIRLTVKADRRKPMDELFFVNDFSHPIEENHPYVKYLELVQLGPSASNKQPWRMVVQDKMVHLYLQRTPNYAQSVPFVMQALDMGIAIYHFEAGLIEDQMRYMITNLFMPNIEDKEYIVSFIIE